jgi:hypothetical protein
MKVRGSMCLALFLGGCAGFAASVKENQEIEATRSGKAPWAQALPAGKGWTCFGASEAVQGNCYRDVKSCNDELDYARTNNILKVAFRDLHKPNPAIKFSDCQPSTQAQCVTWDDMQTQSDGTGKWTPTFRCIQDAFACGEIAQEIDRHGPHRGVSACGAVD